MALKQGIFLVALIAGCFATPILNAEQDLSIFFDHTSSDQSRIVGGSVAPAGSATHMVALTTGVLVRSFTCGGSVISPWTVLTAAHCVDGVFRGSLPSSYRGTVGTNTWNLGGVSFSFARNVTHANYISSTIKNDIALLITSSEITFTNLIAPVAMNYGQVDGGVSVRATGWGRIRAGGSISTQLLELYKHTITGEQCINDVKQAAVELNTDAPPIEPHLELCTFHSRGRGMCNGDSGSGLIRTDIQQLVGVVSWGFPCALGAPDMFVRVSAYAEFVTQNTV